MKARAYRQTFGFTAHGSEARLSTKNVEIALVKIAMIYFYLSFYLFTHYGRKCRSGYRENLCRFVMRSIH